MELDAPIDAVLPEKMSALRSKVNDTKARISQHLLQTLYLPHLESDAGRPAVITPHLTLTLGELHRRSLGAARSVLETARDPGSPVAIILDKGWEQVAAVLAALHAVHPFVPLDPDLPRKRLTHILGECAVECVLTSGAILGDLDLPDQVRPVLLEEAMQAQPPNELPALPDPQDPAYIIFTSGSTGVPKGVVISHKGAVNTILDINKRFDVGSSDRILGLSALSFDLSIFDIFGLLAAGGALVLPEPDRNRDPSHLLNLMTEKKVTLWNSVPMFMQMLLEYARDQAIESHLRLALLSGDRIPPDLPGLIRERFPSTDVISLGGATEASIWSIFHPTGEQSSYCKTIPYGKPLTNQQIYVLNELMEDCPDWVPGRIHIGGEGLAIGFLNDAEKTRQSFVIHPATGETIYHTGDLGRYLPDGNVEFLGREDSQIKIRGFRVEPGEAEHALNDWEHVDKALVIPRGDAGETRYLAAYIVPAKDPQTSFDRHEATLLDAPARLAFKSDKKAVRQDLDPRNAHIFSPSIRDQDLMATYSRRYSVRNFAPEPLALESFQGLLEHLRGVAFPDAPFPKYLYGSAGGLYPVQTYVHVRRDRVLKIPEGLYYYHPIEHRLLLCGPDPRVDESVFPGNEAIFGSSAFSLFLVADLAAIRPMYGDLSERFSLIEAGIMSQLLESAAFGLNLGLCQIGVINHENLFPRMQLTGDHRFMNCILGGGLPSSGPLGFVEEMKRWAKGPADFTRQARDYLKSRLPEYMIPSVFTLVPEGFPLTDNGKVDIRALTALETPAPDTPDFVPPRTRTEALIADIWKSVLNREEIGIHDNFFSLGGDSLLTTVSVGRIRKEFGEEVISDEVIFKSMFEAPTIKTIAEHVDRMRIDPTRPERTSLAALKPEGDGIPLFMVHDGTGKLFVYRHLVECLQSDSPVYGLQILDTRAYCENLPSIEEMASDYIRDMKSVRPQGPYRLGGHCMGGILAFEMAVQLLAQGEAVEQVSVIASTKVPFEVEDEILILLIFLFTELRIPFGKLPYNFDGFFRIMELLGEGRLSVDEGGIQPGDYLAELGLFFAAYRKVQALTHTQRMEMVLKVLGTCDISLFDTENLDLQRLTALYDVYRASVRIIGRYKMPTLAGELTFFMPQGENYVPIGPGYVRNFWNEKSLTGTRIAEIPGDFHSCLAPKNAPALAKDLETATRKRGV